MVEDGGGGDCGGGEYAARGIARDVTNGRDSVLDGEDEGEEGPADEGEG